MISSLVFQKALLGNLGLTGERQLPGPGRSHSSICTTRKPPCPHHYPYHGASMWHDLCGAFLKKKLVYLFSCPLVTHGAFLEFKRIVSVFIANAGFDLNCVSLITEDCESVSSERPYQIFGRPGKLCLFIHSSLVNSFFIWLHSALFIGPFIVVQKYLLSIFLPSWDRDGRSGSSFSVHRHSSFHYVSPDRDVRSVRWLYPVSDRHGRPTTKCKFPHFA